MLIKARLTPFSLPLVRPVQTGKGTLHDREGVLLELEDSSNLKGYGEATPIYGFHMESLRQACDALGRFLPVLLQHKKWSIEEILERFQLDFPAAPAALSAIDTALCDLIAKQQGCSVATFLARQFQTRVSTSVEVNALLYAQDIEKIVREAGDRYDEGFQTFKIKVGVQSTGQDVERISAVRKALGHDVNIRLDANEAWTLEQADEALQALAPLSIEYIEQPLAAADLKGARALRKKHAIPLAADEAACSPTDIQTILKNQAADIIVLKPAATGGPHLSMRMGGVAAHDNVPCVTTTLMDGAVGRAMATHVAAALPSNRGSYACGLATEKLLAQDLAEGLKICDGHIAIDQVKGLGVVINADQLEKVATAETEEFLA
jgi:o-succinylbenzoate synthase